MVLLHLFDERQTRLADFGYIPKCKSKNPTGLNEISLPLARMGKGEICNNQKFLIKTPQFPDIDI